MIRFVMQSAEARWNAFKRTTSKQIRIADIPFPEVLTLAPGTGTPDEPPAALCTPGGHVTLSWQEREVKAMAQHLGGGKKAFQALAMRWVSLSSRGRV